MVDQKIAGVLRDVEITEGKGQFGDWTKAMLIIESNGEDEKVSAFNSPDDASVAQASLKKEIEVTYVYSKDGKYKNLVKGSIVILGVGEAQIKNAESVQPTQAKLNPTPAIPSYADTTGRRIVRQNSWTQANKILEGKSVPYDDIRDLAHKIEEDIMRE